MVPNLLKHKGLWCNETPIEAYNNIRPPIQMFLNFLRRK